MISPSPLPMLTRAGAAAPFTAARGALVLAAVLLAVLFILGQPGEAAACEVHVTPGLDEENLVWAVDQRSAFDRDPGDRGPRDREPQASPPGAPTPPAPAPPGDQPGPQPPGPPDRPGSPSPAMPAQCQDGALPLSASDVQFLVTRSATAINANFTIAVVDRAGRVLGLFRKNPVDPSFDDQAVGLARTAAFFSNNQAPLSSRTVRAISGVHFPAGVKRAPNAALYGIENTNRGCDLNVTFNPGKFIPRATSVAGGSCNAFVQSGCGTGPVTGKPDAFDTHRPRTRPNHDPTAIAVNAGGVPIFRGSFLVGGIGVAGIPSNQAEFAALRALLPANPQPANPPQANELGLSVTPMPLPQPQRVYVDGIQLPLVLQTIQPVGTGPGQANGVFLVGPVDGGCVADGYLVGPMGSAQLTAAQVDLIVRQSIAGANRTRAVIRLPNNSRAKMAIAVGDANGNILALFRMPDATVFSLDVAVAKARNVAYFSAQGIGVLVPPGTAVTNRTINFGAQPLFPAGIDGTEPGPFFDLFLNDLANPCSQGFQPPNANQNGIVFFPGSLPLYTPGASVPVLVGGLGISGDGVEQDDYVAFLGGLGFRPPQNIWADRLFIRGVRLPFLKFPRNPER